MSRSFHNFSRFTTLAGFFLLFAGAMVTSTGSGLSVPDWPLAFGTVFPKMEGGVFYEHGHRLVAGFVASLTVIQCVLAYRLPTSALVKKTTIIAVFIVLLQAVLGGMTVIYQLPTPVSVSHACLGQTYVSILALISLFSSKVWNNPVAMTVSKKVMWGAWVLVALVFSQLFLGAWMRHIGAGLSIPDFPTNLGGVFPPYFSYWVAVHFAHRCMAYFIFAYVIYFGMSGLKSLGLHLIFSRRLLKLILLCVCFQLALGAFVIWTGKHALITSLHVLNGALILCSSILFYALCRKNNE